MNIINWNLFKNSRNLGYVYLITALVLWGGYFIACKQALTVLPSNTVSVLKYAVALLCYKSIEKYRHNPSEKIRKEDRKLALCTCISGYFLAIVCQMVGLRYSSSSAAALISSLNTICIAMLSVCFLHESITKRKAAAIIVSVVGLILIIGRPGDGNNVIGIVLDIIAMVSWSISCILMKKISSTYSSLSITKYCMQLGCIMLLPLCVLDLWEIDFTSSLLSLTTLSAILYAGALGTALAYWCWNQALSLLPASTLITRITVNF